MGAYPFPDPCPKLFCVVFRPLILRKAVKFAAAYEACVPLTAARNLFPQDELPEVLQRFRVAERIKIDIITVSKLHAEYRSLPSRRTAARFAFAPYAPGFFARRLEDFYVGADWIDYFRPKTCLPNERAEVIIVSSDQFVAMMRNLRRHLCRKIETETEQNLGTLVEFVLCRYFVDAELLAAHRAFSASVTQDIQPRSHRALRAKDMTRVVALRGAYLLFELRQERIRIDNHV